MLRNKIILILFFLSLAAGLFAESEFRYNDEGKRDPFIPLVTPDGRLLKIDIEGAVTGLSLEGIIYDESGLSYVLINGEVKRTGEFVNDYQILEIQEDGIILIKEGQTYQMTLQKEEP